MIGRPRRHHREVGSTNTIARELAAAGAPHGTLVTTDHQTAGRGRSDRKWVAPPGSSVLMSLVVRPADPLLPLRAAVAVAEVCGPGAAIKWPNDVLLGGRKVCGILVEGRPQEDWAVLGIGLNVLDVELPPGIDAAALDDGRNTEEVLAALLDRLDARLTGDVLAAWRDRDALTGRRIEWEPGGAGVAAGIDDQGRLLVDTADGRVALDAGEVHLLG